MGREGSIWSPDVGKGRIAWLGVYYLDGWKVGGFFGRKGIYKMGIEVCHENSYWALIHHSIEFRGNYKVFVRILEMGMATLRNTCEMRQNASGLSGSSKVITQDRIVKMLVSLDFKTS